MNRHYLAFVLLVALTGALCSRANPVNPTPTAAGTPVTLTIWRVFEEPEVWQPVIERYQQIHPEVQIKVLKKNYADYELEVANAIAAGAPPDIWMIRNDWLPKHSQKLQAMPDGLLVGDADAKKKGSLTNRDILSERYPDVVASEATLDEKIYGVPLSIDTLALYYNKDHFRESGLAQPPATWREFVTDVEKLTQYEDDAHTKIRRSAVALGTAKNVNRSMDIIAALMLQNHTPMINETKTSALMNGAIPKEGGGLTYPGTSALEFYTAFADPKKSVYTWNNDQPNSIDAFASGKVSMIFSYAYLERQLLQKNPNLNYGVAALPQVDSSTTPIDYPTYWLETVSRNSQHPAEAWQLMKFLSEEGDSLYQAAADKPSAKRLASIPKPNERTLKTDPGTPWSFQLMTAVSWYRGENPGKVEQLLADMIENVITFGQSPQVAIDNTAAQVTKTLQDAGGS